MAKVAEEVGVYKATKHRLRLSIWRFTAGVFISIAFVLYYCDNRYTTMRLWHGETYQGYLFSLWDFDSLCYLRR